MHIHSDMTRFPRALSPLLSDGLRSALSPRGLKPSQVMRWDSLNQTCDMDMCTRSRWRNGVGGGIAQTWRGASTRVSTRSTQEGPTATERREGPPRTRCVHTYRGWLHTAHALPTSSRIHGTGAVCRLFPRATRIYRIHIPWLSVCTGLHMRRPRWTPPPAATLRVGTYTLSVLSVCVSFL